MPPIITFLEDESGVTVNPTGDRVTSKCTACGLGFEACPVEVISEGDTYIKMMDRIAGSVVGGPKYVRKTLLKLRREFHSEYKQGNIGCALSSP